ncbi:glycosyl transferase family 90 [Pseudohoeflea coraliihabitans]|uniref:Lipopolysaccharide biosynthesis protein n=1 Tax=Pseudohoeflea coraliihabitans TaxID=2860393 RepID=A0ABS6WLE2_9HYPH|nr:glycosyl transferase family 90 [Pseudohoeflea sp. DP4N28-3]MBW3096776.1 lipopolysaccharide biosynthesis protein [Pseudohoeflea sp. DP4N28-3]
MDSFADEVWKLKRRLAYYGAAIARDVAPRSFYRYQRKHLFSALAQEFARPDPDFAIFERVNYYNKLTLGQTTMPRTRLRWISRRSSRYFYDLAQYLKYFPPHLRVDPLFGDITRVPDTPRLLKSRPIEGDNANSVVLNLDKLRHYKLYRDTRTWAQKKPTAVWRGRWIRNGRATLLDRYGADPGFDIGYVGKRETDLAPVPSLSPPEHMAYRYIISVEGNDVATNLKWIMASNSLCMMPRSRYETWFMEGKLVPDHHYVELRDDFSDLPEQIARCEADPAWAQAIVRNANAHVRKMLDGDNERLVSLLVLQKYFEATGQLPTSPFTEHFFQRSE